MERNEAESVITDTIENANGEVKNNEVKNNQTNHRKVIIRLITVIVCLLLIVASFFLGSHIRELKQLESRKQRCRTFISFAINKAENEDFADQSSMKALASNIYAACQYSDDVTEADLLHYLWNFVLFHSDEPGAKEIVLQELNKALNQYHPPVK
ncbi:MAG: hypothetical protein K5629_01635 [Eubacteriales bacterium]|nr:hypothetical protein [Eubacteriales bacterium]